MKKYRTTRDILVPAGTELGSPPIASTRWMTHHEAFVALDKDHTAYLSMDLADGLDAGVIEEMV